jgi:profilin
LKDKEMKAIVSSFNDRSEPKEIIANGLKVNDVKYMTIEASEDSVKAKKVRLLHLNRLDTRRED